MRIPDTNILACGTGDFIGVPRLYRFFSEGDDSVPTADSETLRAMLAEIPSWQSRLKAAD